MFAFFRSSHVSGLHLGVTGVSTSVAAQKPSVHVPAAELL